LNDADLQTAMKQVLLNADYTYRARGNQVILVPQEPKPQPEASPRKMPVAVASKPAPVPPPPPVEVNEPRFDEQPASFQEEVVAIPVPEVESPAFLKDYTIGIPLQPAKQYGPVWAIKTNLIYDATSTINVGMEFRLNNCLTLELPLNINLWTFDNNVKFKHYLVQPELRYWIHESFNGHFLGTHLHYARFNAGGINVPNAFPLLKDNRLDGNLYGFGFSYGYQWYLGKRWSMEATFGFGYAYADYGIYGCRECDQQTGRGYHHYFGPSKLGLSVLYMIK
jgi:hypothetical protein